MTRKDVNLEVIKTLVSNQPADKALLKQYTGWGGLREAIYTPEFYLQLKKHLKEDEILQIKKTLKNAYYTPQPVVMAMYDYLVNVAGFTGGKVLEPAAGNGVFVEYMPEAIRQNSKIYAVELEPVSTKILTTLYPDVTVKNAGFETLDIKPVFDLVIGNPPYGKTTLKDYFHPDLNHLAIHHYFVAKSMRLLKEGGILAMVLPTFFLDNQRDHARDIIAQEGGELLNAFRMPENLFSDAKVTVDLVFIRKSSRPKTDWVSTGKIKIKGEMFAINHYFLANPTHVIGELSWVNAYGRKLLNCVGRAYPYQELKAMISVLAKRPRNMALKDSFAEVLTLIDAKINMLQAKRRDLLAAQQNFSMLAHEVAQVGVV